MTVNQKMSIIWKYIGKEKVLKLKTKKVKQLFLVKWKGYNEKTKRSGTYGKLNAILIH